jgi:hypothetical protein
MRKQGICGFDHLFGRLLGISDVVGKGKPALINIPAKKGDHKDRPYGATRRFR